MIRKSHALMLLCIGAIGVGGWRILVVVMEPLSGSLLNLRESLARQPYSPVKYSGSGAAVSDLKRRTITRCYRKDRSRYAMKHQELANSHRAVQSIESPDSVNRSTNDECHGIGSIKDLLEMTSPGQT